MHLEGTFAAKSPQDRVFQFFLDPMELGSCIDDPHTIEPVDANHFNGTVKSGIGFIKGTFNVKASVVERDPPKRARLKVRGSGMGGGFDIEASLALSQTDGATTVRWSADVTMNGPLASMGARVMHGTIDKKTSAFFENARKKLEES